MKAVATPVHAVEAWLDGMEWNAPAPTTAPCWASEPPGARWYRPGRGRPMVTFPRWVRVLDSRSASAYTVPLTAMSRQRSDVLAVTTDRATGKSSDACRA